MANVTDVTDMVERFESLEERAGVQIDALYAEARSPYEGTFYIKATGEIHPRGEPEEAIDAFSIELLAYDERGRMIGSASSEWSTGVCFPFAPFGVEVSVSKMPARLKLMVR
jgi:hypothetical protein